MRKLLAYIVFGIFILSLSMQSCVDKDYDFDKMNKLVEVNIPPVPLGGFDTIFIGFLPEIQPDITTSVKFAFSDTIRGLFDKKTIDQFFYEGSDGVVMSAKLDAMVMPEESGMEIEVFLDIINQDKTRNQDVKIPSQKIISAKGQKFEVRIGSEYMKYMANARDLHFIFAIRIDAIHFTRKDYIYLREVVLFAGGMQLKL